MDDEPLQNGIRISKSLLDQLNGKAPLPRRAPVTIGGGSIAQAVRPPPAALPSAEAEAAALARQDRGLAQAVERSRRVGSLLLKREDEELAKVGALAEELLAKEYQAPSRPLPCQEQAAECLRCYTEHTSDTLLCADAVRAYSDCSRQAFAAVMQTAPAS